MAITTSPSSNGGDDGGWCYESTATIHTQSEFQNDLLYGTQSQPMQKILTPTQMSSSISPGEKAAAESAGGVVGGSSTTDSGMGAAAKERQFPTSPIIESYNILDPGGAGPAASKGDPVDLESGRLRLSPDDDFIHGRGGVTRDQAASHLRPACGEGKLRKPLPIFTSAGKNSMIHVSEEAMAKADRVLAFASPDCDGAAPPMRGGALPRLNTEETGSAILISEDAMVKAGRLLAAAPIDRNEAPDGDNSRWKQHDVTTPPNFGGNIPVFTTAGRGSRITVSEQAMAKAGRLLSTGSEEAPNDKISSCPKASSAPLTGTGTFPAFTTGRGLEILISEDATVKAGRLLAADDDNSRRNQCNWTTSPECGGASAMFSTAGRGTIITVSEKAMVRASRLLSAECEEVPNDKLSSRPKASSVPLTGVSTFPAFTTGRGSEILISEDAMVKAGRLLAAAPCNRNEVPDGDDSRQKQRGETTSPKCGEAFPMFSTAGRGSRITVSKEAMMKASRLLSTDCEEAPNDKLEGPTVAGPLISRPKELAVLPMSTTTGNSSSIAISEEAMNMAELLLTTTNIDRGDEPNHSLLIRSDIPPMFPTARKGSRINITEEAIESARKLPAPGDWRRDRAADDEGGRPPRSFIERLQKRDNEGVGKALSREAAPPPPGGGDGGPGAQTASNVNGGMGMDGPRSNRVESARLPTPLSHRNPYADRGLPTTLAGGPADPTAHSTAAASYLRSPIICGRKNHPVQGGGKLRRNPYTRIPHKTTTTSTPGLEGGCGGDGSRFHACLCNGRHISYRCKGSQRTRPAGEGHDWHQLPSSLCLAYVDISTVS